MTSLFDLTGEALALQRRIDGAAEHLFSEDHEEVAAASEILEGLLMAEADNRQALVTKADAWCWVIAALRNTADGRREHADRLALLAKESEIKAQAMQDRLLAVLGRVDPDATTWELREHKLISRKSIAIELDPDISVEDLPQQFQRVRQTITADKAAIKSALQAGQSVEGAQLVERRNWSIK